MLKKVAIVHPDITLNGGGEAVCAHVLDALCGQFDVSLITWSPPNVEMLDNLFSTQLRSKRFAVVSIGDCTNYPEFLSSRSVVRYALAVRHVQQNLKDYDTVISTWCEIAIDLPAIQYIHVPLFLPGVDHEVLSGEQTSTRDKLLWRGLRAYARWLARGSAAGYKRSLSIANSAWTAELVRKILHVEPALVWPPIPKTHLRSTLSWQERRNAFVCVGRLVPGKRILEIIDCIGRVRESATDVRLHIVGSGSGAYADEVRRRCSKSEFAVYEGRLSNQELFKLLAQSKFGIHGFPHEHFGIALAQMVMAGCLCFAPASGGQAELLANQRQLLYQDFDDATRKILSVIDDPRMQAELATKLGPTRFRLAQHDFQQSFSSIVNEYLSSQEQHLTMV